VAAPIAAKSANIGNFLMAFFFLSLLVPVHGNPKRHFGDFEMN